MSNRTKQVFRLTVLFLLLTITSLIYGKSNSATHSIRIIIQKVALLDIESATSKNLTLKMASPQEAGEALISASDNRIWLNVTSVVESGNARNITVKIDEQLAGINLKVVSDAYTGSGYGSRGSPQPEITLTPFDQILISGIKSSKTGDGAYNGFNLKYIAQSNDTNYGKITSTEGNDITVTYTLTH